MFDSVKSDKVSQYIIDQIRNAIFEGRLNPGDKLPSERKLVEKFKVSKATLGKPSGLWRYQDFWKFEREFQGVLSLLKWIQ